MSRRCALGIVGGALVLLGGGLAVVRTSGYELDPARAAKLRFFHPWQYLVMAALARRIADPDVTDGSVPTADDVDAAGFLDGYVGAMAAPLRRDIVRLLGFCEHVAPLLAKRRARFTRLNPTDQDSVLHVLEAHDRPLLRGAFAALKSLVFMGYYRDPRTWRTIGYAGPFVPARGG